MGFFPPCCRCNDARKPHSHEVCDPHRDRIHKPSGVLTLSQSALKKSILGRLGGDSVGSGVGGEQLEQSAKKPGQVVQDQAQVVAGATEERVDLIASGTAQVVAAELAAFMWPIIASSAGSVRAGSWA
jgi:hypothetical protein